MENEPPPIAVELVKAIYALADVNTNLTNTIAQTNEILAFLATKQAGTQEISPFLRSIITSIFKK